MMPLPEGKRCAFERRQQDIGWGRVFAHIIPFYGIYYGISRRTITPFICSLSLSMCSAFLYGIMVAFSTSLFFYTQATPDITLREQERMIEKEITKKLENDSFGNLLSFITAIIGTKYGIERARKSAYSVLKAEE